MAANNTRQYDARGKKPDSGIDMNPRQASELRSVKQQHGARIYKTFM